MESGHCRGNEVSRDKANKKAPSRSSGLILKSRDELKTYGPVDPRELHTSEVLERQRFDKSWVCLPLSKMNNLEIYL